MKIKLITLLSILAFMTTSCNNFNKDVEEPILLIKTTEGNIKLKLYKDTPIHRDNFMKLVNENFYDGRIFHRVIDGFMIQAGNAGSNLKATEGFQEKPGYTIEAEILPQLHHKLGALAAARMGDEVNPEKRSSGSQFYIVQSEEGTKRLNGNYTVFGETLEGFEVIDRIAKVEKGGPNGWAPVKEVVILSIKQVKK